MFVLHVYVLIVKHVTDPKTYIIIYNIYAILQFWIGIKVNFMSVVMDL